MASAVAPSSTTSAAEALLSVATAVMNDEGDASRKRPLEEEETVDGETVDGRKHRHNVTERRRVERNNQAFEDLAAVLQSRPELYKPASTPCRTKLALLQESAECMKAMFALVDRLQAAQAVGAPGPAEPSSQPCAEAAPCASSAVVAPSTCTVATVVAEEPLALQSAAMAPPKRHAEAPPSPSLPSPLVRAALWPRQTNGAHEHDSLQ